MPQKNIEYFKVTKLQCDVIYLSKYTNVQIIRDKISIWQKKISWKICQTLGLSVYNCNFLLARFFRKLFHLQIFYQCQETFFFPTSSFRRTKKMCFSHFERHNRSSLNDAKVHKSKGRTLFVVYV